MKNKLTLVFIFSLFIVGNCFGQKKLESDKTQIENLIIKSFDEVFSELNKEKISNFYTEDFILLEHGTIWNKDSIAINFDQMKAKIAENKIVVKRVNKIDFIEVKISENSAWVAYHNHAVYENGEGKIYGEDNWLESAVAIRTKNGWRIQMLHSTSKK